MQFSILLVPLYILPHQTTFLIIHKVYLFAPDKVNNFTSASYPITLDKTHLQVITSYKYVVRVLLLLLLYYAYPTPFTIITYFSGILLT